MAANDQGLDVLRYAGHRAPGSARAPWASPPVRVGDIFGDALSAASDVVSALSPANLPGELAQLLAHPGEVAKPLAYGALLLSAGPAGLAEALALDRTGVLDGLAGVVDKLGGVYVAIWKGLALNFGCTWVLSQLGLSQLGFGCAVLSITVDFVKAVIAGDRQAVVGILERVVDLAKSYGLDPTDYVTTVIQTGFQVAGDELVHLFGQLDDLLQDLEQVIPVEEAKYVVQTIRAEEHAITGAVLALPAAAKGSLGEVEAVARSGKVGGRDAVAGGLSAGPVHPPPQPAYLPFARYLRPLADKVNALAANTVGAERWQADPVILQTFQEDLKLAVVLAGSDAQLRDFAHLLHPPARQVCAYVLRTRTPDASAGVAYRRRWAAMTGALARADLPATTTRNLTFLDWLLRILGWGAA